MGGSIYLGEGRGHGRVGVNKVGLGTRRKCTVEVKGRLLLLWCPISVIRYWPS